MSRTLLLYLVILCPFAASAASTGTLDFDDIEKLANVKKELFELIKNDFDIFPVGVARMINLSESKRLNGARLGPYKFSVRPKGTSGPFPYALEIRTKIYFLDRRGRATALANAADFREELTDVCIRPLPPKEYFQPAHD